MMYSAYKLNNQGDNQFAVPCLILTVASCPAYRLLRRQVRWSGVLISLRIFQFVVIHTVKGFSLASEAEVDFFKCPSLFCDPMDFGNLISLSSAFSLFFFIYLFIFFYFYLKKKNHMLPILNPPPSQPPHTIPLGLPSAPAPSIQHRALNLDWHLVSYMTFHMFQ